jgi:aspartate kinase
MQVFKFGGASVKDAGGVKNVYRIIEQYQQEKLLVVISAMGKTTNALEALTRSYIGQSDETPRLLQEIKDYHAGIIQELFEATDPVHDEIANVYVELEWILEEEPHDDDDYIYDQIVSTGEILSTRIVAAYLRKMGLKARWVDARGYIQTDNTYREGNVDWETTAQLINRDLRSVLEQEIIITQGFIGGTSENYTTTLGREGSDYSAAIFASCLDAEAVTIWKDVPGVLNADPKLFPDTRKYGQLPYAEALEMTYYGATVIHPKTIKPLQNKKILLQVKPFLAPEETGTVIGKEESVVFDVPAVILKKNQILLSVTTKDFSFIAETNLSAIFAAFAEHQVKINTMQNSAMTFSCCVDDEPQKTDTLIELLKKEYKVLYNRGLELLTIRHYTNEMIERLTKDRQILIEQRSRNTVQYVLK